MFGKLLQNPVRKSNLTASFLLLTLALLVVLPAQAENGRVFPEGEIP